MRLNINEEMKEILSNFDYGRLLKLEFSNHLLELPHLNKEDIYSGEYFYGKWIDSLTLGQDLNVCQYFYIAYNIGFKWLIDVNKIFGGNSFILIIQYGGKIVGHEKTEDGFHLRLYTEEGFIKHFGEEGLSKYNVPYMSLEI